MSIPNVKDAETFAVQAHIDQKYGDAPYETHLRHAVRVLEEAGFGEEAILKTATWLHDTVEDTEISIQEIERRFGPEVKDIVWRVTDEPGANRKERKLKTYPKIKGHRGATIVKLCDRIANVESSKSNPQKLTMYLKEYPDFRAHLWVPGIADALWDRLDRALRT